jgi:hypothetical protein
MLCQHGALSLLLLCGFFWPCCFLSCGGVLHATGSSRQLIESGMGYSHGLLKYAHCLYVLVLSQSIGHLPGVRCAQVSIWWWVSTRAWRSHTICQGSSLPAEPTCKQNAFMASIGTVLDAVALFRVVRSARMDAGITAWGVCQLSWACNDTT